MTAISLTTVEPHSEPYAPDRLGTELAEHGLPGATFENGLLRFHNARSGAIAQECLEELFGERAQELTPFAFDWRGRQFCRVTIDGNDMALRADCAFVEASPLMGYVETVETLLGSPDIREFLEADTMTQAFQKFGLHGLPFDRCIGMKTPAFLGGQEELDNMEPSDIEVHWSFTSQIYQQVKDLPPGTPISEIRMA